eukprot:UN04399
MMDIKNGLDSTALHIAASAGAADAVRVLVEKGVSTDTTNTIGNTPLHCAAYSGDEDTVRTFVECVRKRDQEWNLRTNLKKAANLAKITPGVYANNRP